MAAFKPSPEILAGALLRTIIISALVINSDYALSLLGSFFSGIVGKMGIRVEAGSLLVNVIEANSNPILPHKIVGWIVCYIATVIAGLAQTAQTAAFLLAYAFLPAAIAYFAVGVLKSGGVQYILTTCKYLSWTIGWRITDIVLDKQLNGDTDWIQLYWGAIITIVGYCFFAPGLSSFLLTGASAVGSTIQGAMGTAQGMATAAFGGAAAAGAAASFAGSAAKLGGDAVKHGAGEFMKASAPGGGFSGGASNFSNGGNAGGSSVPGMDAAKAIGDKISGAASSAVAGSGKGLTPDQQQSAILASNSPGALPPISQSLHLGAQPGSVAATPSSSSNESKDRQAEQHRILSERDKNYS